jgi:hypothetical protein
LLLLSLNLLLLKLLLLGLNLLLLLLVLDRQACQILLRPLQSMCRKIASTNARKDQRYHWGWDSSL